MQQVDPHHRLAEAVGALLEESGASVRLLEELPRRWERFADVALLPRDAFTGEAWSEHTGDGLWAAVAEALAVERVGRLGEISGERRESGVEMLRGDDDWVVRRENGIDYGYRFTECMFSAGNVNERRRMGEVGRSGETVVDLFCGIGYYSLPMLVSGQVAHVHACEWNPQAIEALEWGLEKNGVADRCTVHAGDNRVTAPRLKGIADRVILGLLPSAEDGYGLAFDCLKATPGILHVHGVAPAKDHDSWVAETLDALRRIEHSREISELARYRIKSYAPHWDHLVLDLTVHPAS
jgi:tRNA wybutosine-synthesizing protein 3